MTSIPCCSSNVNDYNTPARMSGTADFKKNKVDSVDFLDIDKRRETKKKLLSLNTFKPHRLDGQRQNS